MDTTTLLIGAVSALAGAVVFMFKWGLSAYESMRVDHRSCMDRERIMLERVIRLEERTGTERRAGDPITVPPWKQITPDKK